MARGKKKTKRKRRIEIEIRPGWLVVDTSSAIGGVHYERSYEAPTTINRGRGTKTRLHTIKTVDHVEVVTALDALKKRADYACRKYCARAAFGWYADDVSVQALRKEINELRKEARVLNKAAAKVGSARRVHIGIVAGRLNVANADTAREIARTIRSVLVDVFNALRSGCVKRILDDDGNVVYKDHLHAPLLKCHNLERIAVGRAGDAVVFALERIPTAKKEILELLRAGVSPAKAGASVDLGAIENAITWFDADDEWLEGSFDPVGEALKL